MRNVNEIFRSLGQKFSLSIFLHEHDCECEAGIRNLRDTWKGLLLTRETVFVATAHASIDGSQYVTNQISESLTPQQEA